VFFLSFEEEKRARGYTPGLFNPTMAARVYERESHYPSGTGIANDIDVTIKHLRSVWIIGLPNRWLGRFITETWITGGRRSITG
jgi:hypothetical protein